MSPVTETTKTRTRPRVAIAGFFADRSGVAAIEFAVIVPLMLVMFFGTVEFSSGLAVDRKVSLVARTIVNLTSQGVQATSADLAGYFVYRRDREQPESNWQRISPAQPVAAPGYHDANVQPGHTYLYAISAVDQQEHESARSAETEETVPGP